VRFVAAFLFAGLVGAVGAVLGLALSGRRRLEQEQGDLWRSWPGGDVVRAWPGGGPVAWTTDADGRIVPMELGASTADVPRF
jgi:hypothetical protein